jgi:hypothetical protein
LEGSSGLGNTEYGGDEKSAEKLVDPRRHFYKSFFRTPCGTGEQSEVSVKAIAQKQRALTGEFLYPKSASFRSHHHFQDGFPNPTGATPKRRPA